MIQTILTVILIVITIVMWLVIACELIILRDVLREIDNALYHTNEKLAYVNGAIRDISHRIGASERETEEGHRI